LNVKLILYPHRYAVEGTSQLAGGCLGREDRGLLAHALHVEKAPGLDEALDGRNAAEERLYQVIGP
jgi:hypothetical protein